MKVNQASEIDNAGLLSGGLPTAFLMEMDGKHAFQTETGGNLG